MVERAQILLLSVALVATARLAEATLIVNGDFETGDISGWSVALTVPVGVIGFPSTDLVTLFDTNGDGVESNSARFNVGAGAPVGLRQGGDIFQFFPAPADSSHVTVTVDIAVQGVHEDGGLFSLIVGGTVVSTHDFGAITGIERSTLSGSVQLVGSGLQEIRIRVTRFFPPSVTDPVFQYIDNIAVQSAPESVPEPATPLLLGGGLVAS